MPILLPTIAEQDRMSWRAKSQASTAVNDLLAANRRRRQAREHDRTVYAPNWGENTRAEARRLLDEWGPDPDAGDHVQALMEAIS
jgi:hypothetical protein